MEKVSTHNSRSHVLKRSREIREMKSRESFWCFGFGGMGHSRSCWSDGGKDPVEH